MKRQLLFFTVLFLSILSIEARSFVSNGIYYNIITSVSPYNVAVTSGVSYVGDLVIPSTVSYNDTVYSVTSINQNTFYGCSSLTSLYLPNTINSIGIGAFYGCSGLTSINLENNNPYFTFVDGILYNKIQSQIIYCKTTKLGKIELLKTVTTIGTGAFYGCSGVTSVLIPNSVSSIGSQAFYNCSGLATVTIGDTLNTGTKATIYIQSTAFSGCTGLTTLSLNVPVASYYYPFQNLSSLKTLVIGNSVTAIDYSAFSTLSGLTKVILGRADLSPVTISVSTGAFSGSTNFDILNLNCNLQITNYSTGASSPFSKISTLSIGNWVTSLGDYSFIGSTNLKSINVPNAVTSIGVSAFAGCNNVTDITLGSSVAKLGTGVFTGCSLLSNIIVDANNTVYSGINGVLFSKDQLTLIQYPLGRSGDYQIPTQVKTIGTSAFSSCIGLKSVTIPQAITSIQATAFANCSGLTSVTIGQADSISTVVVSIASNAFSSCQAITNLIVNKTFSFTSGDNSPFKNLILVASLFIGNGVVSIQDYSFSGLTGLISVRLGQINNTGNNLIIVSGYAFSGCTNLATLELNRNISVTGYQSPFISISNLLVGNGVTSIGDQSFRQCVNLQTITLPATVTNVGNYVFQDCSKLQSISFPGINSLGQGAFYNCTALTSITIPNAVRIIQSFTFNGCTSLTTATLNESITQIQDYAFFSCSKLSTLIIPNSTKSLGASSFGSCTGLTSVILGNTLSTIASGAFYGCTSISTINFPVSLRSLGDNAFQNCSGLSTLYIPSTIATVGNGTFSGCTGITSITIGEYNNPGYMLMFGTSPFSGCSGVTSLILNKDIANDTSSSPFMGLSSLINVTISNHVSRVNTFAFYGCSKITSLTIPNSVTSIGSAAFNGCSSLTSIKLPNSITFIGNSAFLGCSKLLAISIPSTVSVIGNYAFYQCSSLSSIQLPKAVVAIGGLAFGGCTSLNELVAGPSTPAVLGLNCFDKTMISQCKLSVPTGSKIGYQKAIQWKDFSNIIEKNIQDSTSTIDSTYIKQDPISGLSKEININAGGLYQALTSTELANINKLTITGSINAADFLIMRDSMPVLNIVDLSKATINAYTGTLGTGGNTVITYPANTVPDNAFFTINMPGGKISLISVLLPCSVTAIGNNAFKNCSSLKIIPLPSSVTSIGDYAYYWCAGSIGSFTIPSSVNSIGIFAFSRCSGFTNVTLPGSITTIERAAFAECSSLIAFTIPSTVKTIKESAFYNCGCLISINIPSSVTSIEDNVFVYCGFATITLPPTITSISDYTFTECHALQSISIPNGVKSLGGSVFLNCYSLATILLPSSLTSISYQVFSNCRNLTSIYAYPTTPIVLTDYSTFNDVNKSNCILYVPSGSLKAYQQASQWGDFINIREMTTTDVSVQTSEQLSIYPNPIIDGFQIKGLTESGIVTLTNLNGSVLFTKQVTGNEYISINTLPEGIYIAKIETKNFTIERKIVKK